MALEPPAPWETAGRAEDRDVIAVGIAEGALALAQHALDDAHVLDRLQAALVQHRAEERMRRLALRRLHLAEREALPAARDVVPVAPVVGLEGDHRLPALRLVEQAEEAAGRLGDALGGIDRLGRGAAERQEGRGRQHHAAQRMAALLNMLVRMPAVVRHRALPYAALLPYFRLQP